jgi:hypothetical protein
MRKLSRLAADLLYVIDTYAWVPMVLFLILLVICEAIDNPVLNPQNFGAP